MPRDVSGGLRRAQAVSIDPVVRAVGAQRGCQSQVAARLLAAAGLLERAAQAEVGEVVDRVAVDDGLELHRRFAVAPAAEVGAPERLADRALLGLHLARL